MITVLRRTVYFGSLAVAVMAIVLMMIKEDLGYIPSYLQLGVLAMIFVLGVLLIILISKRGMGG